MIPRPSSPISEPLRRCLCPRKRRPQNGPHSNDRNGRRRSGHDVAVGRQMHITPTSPACRVRRRSPPRMTSRSASSHDPTLRHKTQLCVVGSSSSWPSLIPAQHTTSFGSKKGASLEHTHCLNPSCEHSRRESRLRPPARSCEPPACEVRRRFGPSPAPSRSRRPPPSSRRRTPSPRYRRSTTSAYP